MAKVKAIVLQDYKVLRRLHGFSKKPNSLQHKFGAFVVGRGQEFMPVQPPAQMTFLPEPDELYVAYIGKAEDPSEAVELADISFHRFDLVLRMLIGERGRSREVGVLNYSERQRHDRFVLNTEGNLVSTGGEWKGPVGLIPLDIAFFTELPAPFLTLFELISKDRSKLEERILLCTEWIGQAIADRNPASAFVKAAIALEVMFSQGGKGPITPSIMAQIAESCAFLLGDEKTSAVEVERKVKYLYGVRSAIVHAGKDKVEECDLEELLAICDNVIRTLLLEARYREMKTIDDLADYFKRMKYSLI